MKGRISLPLDSGVEPNRTSRAWPMVLLGVLALATFRWFPRDSPTDTRVAASACAQAEPSLPTRYNLTAVYADKERIVERLSGAVKIPTQIYDVMGPVDEDPRWETMGTFQEYLDEQFPLLTKNLKKTVTDWALVYEWIGSDTSLKPLFLTAHQDVVPVLDSTVPQWTHPPFSGYYDGTRIWGRGASDTKGSLIAIMSAIEHLLETTDFAPTRTVVLGFGSDEERGGQVGAPAINRYLMDKYGKDSMSLLIDEGSGLINTWGQQFAVPGVGEKGHYDLGIRVETLGGHSSVPPAHTGIGLMSLLIAELEANPHPMLLSAESPIYGFMECAAAFADEMPATLKKTVLRSEQGDARAWHDLPKIIVETGVPGNPAGPGQGNPIAAFMTTTQATDLIDGGVKVNALPEVVTAVVNHRVRIGSSHVELQDRVIKVLSPVVAKYNLSLVGFEGELLKSGGAGRVILSEAFGYYTDPAPTSPFTIEDPAYRVMASTARGMWASRPEVSEDGSIVELAQGEDLVMAPFSMSGNTDTRRYWDLTRNIYRFRYIEMSSGAGAHTINEYTTADNLVEFTRWYQAIILAMDASKEVA